MPASPKRAHVSLSRVYRGADLLGVPEVEPFGSLFDAALDEVLGADSALFRLYETLDEVSIKSLDESLDRYGFADLQTVYFPGIDLFTHIAPDPIESQQRYLKEVIDPAVGHVLARYRAAGVLEGTYVLFVSDHGQTPVVPEHHNALWGQDIASFRRAGVWTAKAKSEPAEMTAQFVVASNRPRHTIMRPNSPR